MEYIEDKLGCSPNIIGSNTRSPKAPCHSNDQLTEMAKLSRWLDEADDTAIFEMTGDGCLESTSPASDQSNEKGSRVEADVAMCPLLSLFRREEKRDGDTYMPYALHNF